MGSAQQQQSAGPQLPGVCKAIRSQTVLRAVILEDACTGTEALASLDQANVLLLRFVKLSWQPGRQTAQKSAAGS